MLSYSMITRHKTAKKDNSRMELQAKKMRKAGSDEARATFMFRGRFWDCIRM